MISYQEALDIILAQAAAQEPVEMQIPDCLDHVLAEPTHCRGDLPPFDNSAMDGYAVRAADLEGTSREQPVRLKIVETLYAGAAPQRTLAGGEVSKIMTGAPVPEGADSVIRVEDTKQEADEALFFVEVKRGACIRRRGEELKDGALVLETGTHLGAAEIGVLASIGRPRVRVSPKPRVCFFPTGDEIVPPGETLKPGQVRDVNSFTLETLLQRLGCPFKQLGRASDDKAQMKELIAQAGGHDVLITSGSVSMGEKDILQGCLTELGMETLFYKIRMKPGKPVLFGRLGKTLVFCLPGNTVSTFVTFILLVRPALLKLAGRRDIFLKRVEASLENEFTRKDGRQEFLRVSLEAGEGRRIAHLTGKQGSSILTSLLGADALLEIPEERTTLSPSDLLTAHLLEF